MDLYLKRMLLMATALCVLGVYAAWATGASWSSPEQDRVEYVDGPTVASLATTLDSLGRIKLYRVWSDGHTEMSRQLNGTNDFLPWVVIAE